MDFNYAPISVQANSLLLTILMRNLMLRYTPSQKTELATLKEEEKKLHQKSLIEVKLRCLNARAAESPSPLNTIFKMRSEISAEFVSFNDPPLLPTVGGALFLIYPLSFHPHSLVKQAAAASSCKT